MSCTASGVRGHAAREHRARIGSPCMCRCQQPSASRSQSSTTQTSPCLSRRVGSAADPMRRRTEQPSYRQRHHSCLLSRQIWIPACHCNPHRQLCRWNAWLATPVGVATQWLLRTRRGRNSRQATAREHQRSRDRLAAWEGTTLDARAPALQICFLAEEVGIPRGTGTGTGTGTWNCASE